MDEQELIKERFKSAVSSAVKAISEKYDIEIKFGNNLTSKKNSLNLPDIVNLNKMQDFINLRAFADSEALKLKYNNDAISVYNGIVIIRTGVENNGDYPKILDSVDINDTDNLIKLQYSDDTVVDDDDERRRRR